MGAPGDPSLCDSRFYSKIAGLLQVAIRQPVSVVCMLMPVCCMGSRQSRLLRDPWQNRLCRNSSEGFHLKYIFVFAPYYDILCVLANSLKAATHPAWAA